MAGRKKIIIVDDDRETREMLKMALELEGYELCRAVKKNDEFRDIPVIFISAKKTANDIRTGLAAGAADYFSKPIDMERLLSRIAQLIGPSSPASPERRP